MGYNKTYFYAECGVNRLLVKAGHEASKITLTANINGGRNFTATITSVPFRTENGLTKTMQQVMKPGKDLLQEGAKIPRGGGKFVASTASERENIRSSQTVEVMVGNTKLNFGNLKAYNYGTGTFAPALISLDALKASSTKLRL